MTTSVTDDGAPAVVRGDVLPQQPETVAETVSLTWALSTALLALLEWALLAVQHGDAVDGFGRLLALLGLGFGNWLPYTLLALLVWLAVDRGTIWLRRRTTAARARAAIALLVGLLASGYAYWLADFTFSGPQARALSMRPLLVFAMASVICLAFAASAWISTLQVQRLSTKILWGLICGCGSFAALVLSGTVLRHEYEPLHAFLAIWAVVLATLSGRNLSRSIGPLGKYATRSGGLTLILCAVACSLVLARSETNAGILWSKTAAARYLTERWTLPSSRVAPVVADPGLKTKPNVESTASEARRKAVTSAPHIVIFSIDGLRPDHVGAYGYTKRQITPNIDRFAERGVRFTRAFSSTPWTMSFNSSLLLGRWYPSTGKHRPPPRFQRDAITTLLDQRDYHVMVKAWFEYGKRNDFDPKTYRIDTFVPKPTDLSRLEEPMATRMEAVEAHLIAARERKQPAFIWMHLLSTHPVRGTKGDFSPHPDFDFGDTKADRYDSAIAGSDAWLPPLERLMQEHADPARKTIWIICSDHGMLLSGAGKDLSIGNVHVPLIVVAPGLEPRTIDQPVDASLDLAATIVDLAGIAPPQTYQGVSLVPLLLGEPAAAEMSSRVIPLMRRKSQGAVHGSYKLMVLNKTFSLVDFERDPEERQNLFEEHNQLATDLWAVQKQESERRLAEMGLKGRDVSDDEE